MAIPQITFPLKQEDVKKAYEELTSYLRGLQAEQRIVQEMLKVLPTFCDHTARGGPRSSSCSTCGFFWSGD